MKIRFVGTVLVAVLAFSAFTALAQNRDAEGDGSDVLEYVGFFVSNQARARAVANARAEARVRAREVQQRTGRQYVAVRADIYELSHPESVFTAYSVRAGQTGAGSSPDEAAEDMILTPQILPEPKGGNHVQSLYVTFGPEGEEAVMSPAAVTATHSRAIAKASDRTNDKSNSGSASTEKNKDKPSTSTKSDSDARRWDNAMKTLDDPRSSQADRDRAEREAAELIEKAQKAANVARCASDSINCGCPECSADPSARMFVRTKDYNARIKKVLKATTSVDREAIKLRGLKALDLP